jgi:hypothetical protein
MATAHEDIVRPRFAPGLILVCAWLVLVAVQNAMLVSVALRIWRATLNVEADMYANYLTFGGLKLVAAFSAILLLLIVRRPLVPYLAAAAILFCDPLGTWLQNYLLQAYQPGRSVIELPNLFDLASIAVSIAAAAYLVVSRRVRALYDNRLLPGIFK